VVAPRGRVLHALAGLLAMAFLVQCGFGRGPALLASLAFSLHPVHVDSAAWVSGIQDVWLGVTALAAAIAWQACRRGALALRLPALAVAYAAALLSKEAAVGLLLFAAADAFAHVESVRRTPAGPPWRSPCSPS
jgi:hypothetical protein